MCDMIGWKVRAMPLVCGRLSPFLSLVERLDLTADYDYWPSLSQEEDDTVSFRFLELFEPFTAIQSFYVSESLTPFISSAGQRRSSLDQATEVLPNLRDLFTEGLAIPRTVQESHPAICRRTTVLRQPIAIHH